MDAVATTCFVATRTPPLSATNAFFVCIYNVFPRSFYDETSNLNIHVYLIKTNFNLTLTIDFSEMHKHNLYIYK